MVSEVTLNVLLLLSYEQQPAPDEEVLVLEAACEQHGEVFFASTRNLSSLDEAGEVAFYADGQDSLGVLATAKFRGFLPIGSAEASRALSKHILYGARQPQRMRGLVRLSEFKTCAGGVTIGDLSGWMADGSRLTLETLPSGHAATSVYYVKHSGPTSLSGDLQARLWRAKCLELEDKYADTRTLWDRDVRRLRRVHAEAMERVYETHDEMTANNHIKRGGLWKNAALTLQSIFPNLRFLQDSVEVLFTNYPRSQSIMQRLSELNDDPMLSRGLRDGKALQGLKKWFEARAGDNLGRLYYRAVGVGRDAFVAVLLSQKDEQSRDVERAVSSNTLLTPRIRARSPAVPAFAQHPLGRPA